VVGHDGERVNTPRAANSGLTELFLQPFPVYVIAYDVLAAVAAGHQVVDRATVLET
jgi:hypothetical protein